VVQGKKSDCHLGRVGECDCHSFSRTGEGDALAKAGMREGRKAGMPEGRKSSTEKNPGLLVPTGVGTSRDGFHMGRGWNEGKKVTVT